MENKGEYKAGGGRTPEECVKLATEISGSMRQIATSLDAIIADLVAVPKIRAMVAERSDDIYTGLDAAANIMAGISQVINGAAKVGKLPKSVRAFMVKKAIAYFAKHEEDKT